MSAEAPKSIALRSAHLIVSGKVQGVFYRKHTRSAAKELGLTGWVRNLSDGRVEILAEGTEQQLAQLQQWCYKGSPRSKVTDVTLVPVVVRSDTEEAAASETAAPTVNMVAMPILSERAFKGFDVVK